MESKTIRKIAVLRALYLGDMLCVIPTMRAVRNAFPLASITLIGLPWQKEFAERFAHYFDDFVEFPGWPGLPEQSVDATRAVTFLNEMQEKQFDLVMQMQGNGAITNALCMLFNARIVCGLRKKNDYCPDHKLFPVSDDDEHEVLRFLRLADALDVSRQGHHLEFVITPEESRRGFEMLTTMPFTQGRFFCIHPGARDPRRRWPAENFAHVADVLAQNGYDIVLTGSEDERDLLSYITSIVHVPVVNLVERFGNVDIGTLGYLISKSAGLLSNDTGVSHVASALGTRSVIIFSEFSFPHRWAPLDTDLHTVILPDQSSDIQYIVDSCLKAAEVMVR